MKISLVVPCFNEEKNLPILYAEISHVMRSIVCDYELLFIKRRLARCDACIVQGLCIKDGRVTHISFSQNFGKEAAMYAGLYNADNGADEVKKRPHYIVAETNRQNVDKVN